MSDGPPPGERIRAAVSDQASARDAVIADSG